MLSLSLPTHSTVQNSDHWQGIQIINHKIECGRLKAHPQIYGWKLDWIIEIVIGVSMDSIQHFMTCTKQ